MGGKLLCDSEVASPPPSNLTRRFWGLHHRIPTPISHGPISKSVPGPFSLSVIAHTIFSCRLVGGCLSCHTQDWGRSWDATLVLWDISASRAQLLVKAWHFGLSAVCVIPIFSHTLGYAITLGRYFKDLQILLVVFSSRDYSISPAVTVLTLPVQLDTLQTAAMNIR